MDYDPVIDCSLTKIRVHEIPPFLVRGRVALRDRSNSDGADQKQDQQHLFLFSSKSLSLTLIVLYLNSALSHLA